MARKRIVSANLSAAAFVCLNNVDVIVKDQPIMYIVTIAIFSYCLTSDSSKSNLSFDILRYLT